MNLAALGHTEAQRKAAAGRQPCGEIGRRQVPAAPRVQDRSSRRDGRQAFSVELLGRAETAVRLAIFKQPIRVRLIERFAFRLPVRSVWAIDVRALVPGETEPPQILEDGCL